MKRIIYEYIPAWLLLGVLGLIVLHAPLSVFIGTHIPVLNLIVKAWKEIFLLIVLLIIIIDVSRRRMWRDLLRDRLILLSAAYALIHLIVAVVLPVQSTALIVGFMIDLRFVLLFVLIRVYLRCHPQYRESFIKICMIGAGIVIGFTLIQLLLPRDALSYIGYGSQTIAPYLTVDGNPNFTRLSSTLRGPNPLGAYVVIVLAGVVAFGMAVGRMVRDKRVKLLHTFLALGSLVALWTSYSRSAWIGALLTVVVLGFIYAQQTKRRINWRLITVGLLVAACVGIALKDTTLFRNIFLHDNPTTGAVITSNEGHIASLSDGLTYVLQHPFGNGVGTTNSASLFTSSHMVIENYYLTVAYEIGWLGLAIFATLFVFVLRGLWRQRSGDWLASALLASGIGIAAIGFLLPVWTDDTVSIIWWGLAAVALSKGGHHGTTPNKKAT